MTAASPQHDRLLELLADRAVQGLSAPEAAELGRLLNELPGAVAEAERLELAAAALDLAFARGAEAFELPASLRAKLSEQAATWSASRPMSRAAILPDVLASIRPPVARKIGWGGVAGWLAAAACLALAVVGWFGRGPGRAPSPIEASTARATLLSASADVKQWGWTALGELEKKQVTGDAVWSTARQQGFMTFAGLPANDPTKEQYQLWIFDPGQSDKTPVDGGVFDVTAEGTVVVSMDPKIRVSDAAMFAITIEKPGGVVVSGRSRLVLIAKPG